jgi:hypothetical protein
VSTTLLLSAGLVGAAILFACEFLKALSDIESAGHWRSAWTHLSQLNWREWLRLIGSAGTLVGSLTGLACAIALYAQT